MAKSKAKPAKKPAVKAKSKTKSKPIAKTKSKPKSKAKPKPAAKAKPKVSAKPQAKATKPQAKAAQPPVKTAKFENISAIFSPLDDRLIIEALVDADRTPGGLYIPDTVGASDRPKQGKVLAVGRGHQTKKGRIQRLDVQLGDTVLFEAYMGQPLKIGQRDCLVIRESQLLGIIRS